MRAIVSGIISYEILLLIAFVLVQAIQSGVDRDSWTTTANTTWDSLNTYIWLGFGLLAIVPVVLVGMYMVGILNFGGGKGG